MCEISQRNVLWLKCWTSIVAFSFRQIAKVGTVIKWLKPFPRLVMVAISSTLAGTSILSVTWAVKWIRFLFYNFIFYQQDLSKPGSTWNFPVTSLYSKAHYSSAHDLLSYSFSWLRRTYLYSMISFLLFFP